MAQTTAPNDRPNDRRPRSCGFLECKKDSSVALRYQRGDLTPNQFAMWRPKSDIARGFNAASRFFSDERFFRYSSGFDEATQRATGWNRSDARNWNCEAQPLLVLCTLHHAPWTHVPCASEAGKCERPQLVVALLPPRQPTAQRSPRGARARRAIHPAGDAPSNPHC